jgi:hypothetical protein
VPARLKITAEVEGFGQPIFSWKVNGHRLSAIGGSFAENATVLTDNPSDPAHPHSTSEVVDLSCSVVSGVSNYLRQAGELDITVAGFPGHVELNVECDVTERSISTGPTTGFASPLLDTQRLRYDPRYYADEARCRAAVEAILHKYVRYQRIVLVLTLPDPPPDLMRVVVAAIREVAQELAQIGHADRAVAHRLGTLVSRRLGAPEGWFEGGIARQETQE